jgi:hypothetical protein
MGGEIGGVKSCGALMDLGKLCLIHIESLRSADLQRPSWVFATCRTIRIKGEVGLDQNLNK